MADWPVGIYDALRRGRLVITEGGGDLLGALHFGLLGGCIDQIGTTCFLGAAARFPAEILPFLKDTRARVFIHNDPAGARGARRWAQQVAAAGGQVDGFSFGGLTRSDGELVQDLNDLAHISATSFEEHREIIENVMFF